MVLAHEAMTHALFRCINAPKTPTEQVKAFLDGLRESLGLKLAIAGKIRITPGTYPPQLDHAMQVGEMLPREQRLVERYFSDLGTYPDPAHIEAVRMMESRGWMCARRQDLIPDDLWYTSDHFIRLRKPNHVDACMYAAVPVPGWTPPPQTGELAFIGFGFHRDADAPQFAEAERDAFERLLPHLAPMFGTWLSKLETAPSVLELPARLRGVLACLIEGDSEKQAASRLNLSPHTVHQYVKLIHSRLSVKSRGELLAWCSQHGITADAIRSPIASRNPVGRRTHAQGTTTANVRLDAHEGEGGHGGDDADTEAEHASTH